MYLASFMAFLHHLGAFTLAAALAVELALFRQQLTAPQARRLQRADLVLGLAATLVLVAGLLRVFYFEKGSDYYFSNGWFIAKLSLFVVVALISVYPTVSFLSWRKALAQGLAPEIPEHQARWIRRCLLLELHGLIVIILAAPLMARGVGYFG